MKLRSKPVPFCCVPCSHEGWLEVAVHYTGGAKPSLLRVERLANMDELALPKRFSGDSVEELYQVRRTTASLVKSGKASGQSTPVRRYAVAESYAVQLECSKADESFSPKGCVKCAPSERAPSHAVRGAELLRMHTSAHTRPMVMAPKLQQAQDPPRNWQRTLLRKSAWNH